MLTLHAEYITILNDFGKLFSKRIWEHARILLIGSILSPAERTVTAAFSKGHRDDVRVMGLSGEKHFQNYNRVLSRAVWSSLEASQVLLELLINTFASNGPILMGLEIRLNIVVEQRSKLKASTVACSLQSWPLCKNQRLALVKSDVTDAHSMGKTSLGIAFSHGACAFQRYFIGKARKHKKLTERARQIVLQVRLWLPKRLLMVVADSGFAVFDLLWQLRQLKNLICMITRFSLDIALYESTQPMRGKMGSPRKKGRRLPTLEKIAEDKMTRWKRLTVQAWYGENKREIEITSKTAVWFHGGKPPLPIRWVIVRNPKKIFKTQALLCIGISISPE